MEKNLYEELKTYVSEVENHFRKKIEKITKTGREFLQGCKEGSGLLLLEKDSLYALRRVKEHNLEEFITEAKKYVLDVEKIPYDEILEALKVVNNVNIEKKND